MPEREVLLNILDLARWAPSGDNTQPWRFEIVSGDHIAIHGFDTRDHVLYDFDGHPSHMAHGALLETLRIAATQHGLGASWQRRPGTPETAPIYDVTLTPIDGLAPDPLIAVIRQRCVQRRMMRTTPLTEKQREAIRAAVGPDFSVRFFESFAERYAVAKLLWRNAKLRLTCPEAFEVHRSVIEWGAQYSADRIPDQAVGVDPITARLMHWVMQSWERVEFFNRYLGGTIAPRIQLDFLPALACAAHVLLMPKRAPQALEDHVRAGEAMQRLWLTVASQGLYLQPEMTPVIFRWYAQAQRPISRVPAIDAGASLLAGELESLAALGRANPCSFFCRVGFSGAPDARSLRRELNDLMVGSGGIRAGLPPGSGEA